MYPYLQLQSVPAEALHFSNWSEYFSSCILSMLHSFLFVSSSSILQLLSWQHFIPSLITVYFEPQFSHIKFFITMLPPASGLPPKSLKQQYELLFYAIYFYSTRRKKKPRLPKLIIQWSRPILIRKKPGGMMFQWGRRKWGLTIPPVWDRFILIVKNHYTTEAALVTYVVDVSLFSLQASYT